MSDEGSIPIAVGQNVTIEEPSTGGKIFGYITVGILFVLFCWAIYYFFFRKSTPVVAAAAAPAVDVGECVGGVCPVRPRMRGGARSGH